MDFKESLKTFTKAVVYENFDLGQLTSYKTGGLVDYYIEVNCVKDIRDAIEFANTFGVKYKIIGNCTNILLSDEGYRGAVISLKRLNSITFSEKTVEVLAGANLSSLSRLCALNGYLDNVYLCGIPASIGGAIVMNAGAFGKNISDGIISVSALHNGKLVKFYKADCDFSYRSSGFLGGEQVILSVQFELNNFIGSESAVLALGDILRRRKILQPIGRSCGSVFKNQPNYYAGELVERAGLKGARVGNAIVSERHANFILANQGATSRDIKGLIDLIKNKVKEKFGVTLNEEVEFLGEF